MLRGLVRTIRITALDKNPVLWMVTPDVRTYGVLQARSPRPAIQASVPPALARPRAVTSDHLNDARRWLSLFMPEPVFACA